MTLKVEVGAPGSYRTLYTQGPPVTDNSTVKVLSWLPKYAVSCKLTPCCKIQVGATASVC